MQDVPHNVTFERNARELFTEHLQESRSQEHVSAHNLHKSLVWGNKAILNKGSLSCVFNRSSCLNNTLSLFLHQRNKRALRCRIFHIRTITFSVLLLNSHLEYTCTHRGGPLGQKYNRGPWNQFLRRTCKHKSVSDLHRPLAFILLTKCSFPWSVWISFTRWVTVNTPNVYHKYICQICLKMGT